MRARSVGPADLAALPVSARAQLALNLIGLAHRRPEMLRSAHSPAQLSQGPARRVGRNDPCPCGSGKKFKKCCLGAAPSKGA